MAQEKPEPEKKIIIDEDWKSQAEAEKQRLADQEQAGPEAGAAGEGGMPPANFATLVTEIVTQAYFAMGAIADPRGRRFRDMGLAKHHIDMLGVIEEKTKGNLSEEEKTLLDNALYECRMMFVNLAQKGA